MTGEYLTHLLAVNSVYGGGGGAALFCHRPSPTPTTLLSFLLFTIPHCPLGHCPMHTVHCPLSTNHGPLSTAQWVSPICTVQCTMYMTASKRAGKKQCPGTHRIFVNVLPHHADLLMHHVSLQCFSKFFPATLTFRVMRNKFSALKTCFNANMHSHCWW